MILRTCNGYETYLSATTDKSCIELVICLISDTKGVKVVDKFCSQWTLPEIYGITLKTYIMLFWVVVNAIKIPSKHGRLVIIDVKANTKTECPGET